MDTEKKKMLILITVIISLFLVVIISISLIIYNINNRRNINYDETGYLEEDSINSEDEELYIIGQELYDKALEIYKINPYCGKKYNDISKDSIITENNKSYYETNYRNINQINKEVSKYFVNNPFPSVKDYIIKNKKVYCKYTSSKNTKNFLGQYYLDLENNSDNTIKFKVTTMHLGTVHKKTCNIYTPLECSSEEMINQNSVFIIEKKNNKWKISEFTNPYY